MATIDRNLLTLQYCEQRVGQWEQQGAAIGLQSAQTLEFKNDTNTARVAYDAVQAAKLALRNAVLAQNDAFRDLRRTLGDNTASIRAFARNSPDPNKVYANALIAPPRPPQPIGPPTAAFDLNASLDLLVGGLKLTWKASQDASGVVYRVERTTTATPNATWDLIGLTGSKFATDVTVPNGTSRVLYRVVAQRGSLQANPSPVLDIRFGTGPGEMDLGRLKLAA
jgi:hypothetical protein